MQIPKLIVGGVHNDDRGTLHFNNVFDASDVKRMYTITNEDQNFIRAWQGHRIERRWFSAIGGAFRIKLIQIDDWETPSKNLPQLEFLLSSETLDILLVPSGFVTSIQAVEENSKLLLMSDYMLGEVKDEYRFDRTYFLDN
jgi:dTDP-4-dehydrorhamnose 3,5-epimerase-like enzyme